MFNKLINKIVNEEVNWFVEFDTHTKQPIGEVLLDNKGNIVYRKTIQQGEKMKLVFPIFIEEEKPTLFNKRVYPKGTLTKIFKKLNDCLLARQVFIVQDIWVDKAMEANSYVLDALPFYCLKEGYVFGIVTDFNVTKEGTGTVVVEMFDTNEAQNVQKQYEAGIDLQIDFQLEAKFKKKTTEEGYPIVDTRGMKVSPVLRLMNVDRQKEQKTNAI